MTEGFIPRLKSKVIGATANVIAAPSILRSQRKQAKADIETDALKLSRETKNVSLAGKDYRDPVFRARATAASAKAERGLSVKRELIKR